MYVWEIQLPLLHLSPTLISITPRQPTTHIKLENCWTVPAPFHRIQPNSSHHLAHNTHRLDSLSFSIQKGAALDRASKGSLFCEASESNIIRSALPNNLSLFLSHGHFPSSHRPFALTTTSHFYFTHSLSLTRQVHSNRFSRSLDNFYRRFLSRTRSTHARKC